MEEPGSPGSEPQSDAGAQPAIGKKVGRGIRAACKRRKLPSWTADEELALARLHMEHGNSWASIAERLNGRTAAEAKNIWHSTLRARTPTGRSLLLEYARTVMGRCGDSKARREAFRNAVKLYGHLHGLNTSAPAGGGGGPPPPPQQQATAGGGGSNQQQQQQHTAMQIARMSGSGAAMEADKDNAEDGGAGGGSDERPPLALAGAAGLPHHRQQQLAHQQQAQQQQRAPARASGSQLVFGDSGGGVAGLAAGSSRSGSLQQTSGDSNPTSNNLQLMQQQAHQAQQQPYRGAYGTGATQGEVSPVEGYSPHDYGAASAGGSGGRASHQARPGSVVGMLAVPDDAAAPRALSAVEGFAGGPYARQQQRGAPAAGGGGSGRVLAGWLAAQQAPAAADFTSGGMQQHPQQHAAAGQFDYVAQQHVVMMQQHHQHHQQRTADALAEAAGMRAKSAPHPTMMQLFDQHQQQRQQPQHPQHAHPHAHPHPHQQMMLQQQQQQQQQVDYAQQRRGALSLLDETRASRGQQPVLSLIAEDIPGVDPNLLHADPPELTAAAAAEAAADHAYSRSSTGQDWALGQQQQQEQQPQRSRLLSATSDVAARFAALDVSKSAGAAAAAARSGGPSGGLLLPASPFAGLTLPQLSRLGGNYGSGFTASADAAFVAQAAADGALVQQHPFSPQLQLQHQQQQQRQHRALQLAGAATAGSAGAEGAAGAVQLQRSFSTTGEQLQPGGGRGRTDEGDGAMGPMQQPGSAAAPARQLQSPTSQRAASKTGLLARICSGSTHGFLSFDDKGRPAAAAADVEEGAAAAGGSPPPFEAATAEAAFEFSGMPMLPDPAAPRYASATGFSRLSATSSPGFPPAALYQSPQQQQQQQQQQQVPQQQQQVSLQQTLMQAQRRRITFNQPPSWQAPAAERAPASAPGGGYGPGGYAAAAQLLAKQEAGGGGGGNSDSGCGRASSGGMQMRGFALPPGTGIAAAGSCSGVSGEPADGGYQAVVAASASAGGHGVVTMGPAAAAAAGGVSHEEDHVGVLAAVAYSSAPGGGVPGGYHSVGSSNGAGGGLGPGGYFSAGAALLGSGSNALEAPGVVALSAGGGDLATVAAVAAAAAGDAAGEGGGGGGRRRGRERYDDVARLLLRSNGDSGVVAMGLDSDPELMQCFDQPPTDAMDRDYQ